MSWRLAEYRLWLGKQASRAWHRPLPWRRWQPAGTGEGLDGLPEQAGGRLSLLLGGDWAPTVCLPWVEGLRHPRDWQDYARLMLAQRYGGEPVDWHVRWQWGGDGRAALASGVPLARWQQLAEAVRARGLRLVSAVPLMARLAERATLTRQGEGEMLLVNDGGLVQWLGHRQGQWQDAGMVNVAAGMSPQAIEAMLASLGVELGLPRWFVPDEAAHRPWVWSEV